MSEETDFLAMDLGAESCRALAVRFDGRRVRLEEVHRFDNHAVELLGGLYWDAIGIYSGVVEALRRCVKEGVSPRSIGVDSWAVDFGLLDRAGDLLSTPRNYRGPHTNGMMELALKRVTADRLYGVTGIQFIKINTLYQLLGLENSPTLEVADRLLLMPDLLNYWLTGEIATEYTNATTIQLYSHAHGDWARKLMGDLGVRESLFTEIVGAGTELAPLRPVVSKDVEPGRIPVVSVASHDTASAVVAVPAADEHFAYISSGTWSLVGVESDRPVLTAEAREANFTNEGGFGGRIRLLKNVMGLWILQGCRSSWSVGGEGPSYEQLVALAEEATPFDFLFDPDAPELLAPGDMPSRLKNLCGETGQRYPQDIGAVARGIFESLALKYAMVLSQARRLSGIESRTLHIVGGGSQNKLLCQLTSDATGLPVVAGPVEATALGNGLVQAHALGYVSGIEEIRRVVRDSYTPRRYQPTSDREVWREAAARLKRLTRHRESSIEGAWDESETRWLVRTPIRGACGGSLRVRNRY